VTARRWSARVAPLGEPASDGRVLSPVGRWVIANRTGVPLIRLLEGHDGPLHVGRVLAVDVVDRVLVATGIVTDTDTTTLMRAGRVWPELQLGADTAARVRGERIIYDRGRITAIVAGRAPAWPTVSFDLEER
jgi:hypothetical protein